MIHILFLFTLIEQVLRILLLLQLLICKIFFNNSIQRYFPSSQNFTIII